ncbi:hypothetical protein ERJ75_001046900 [Trypanosoma vivax]|uniref:Uncharacterized protein n=1 Tax=Trypanosoma vivax (strain Y486) TaxID=1055687 RepID=G0TZZ4_TRYVY|nr:hypothetical protein TRVL_08879 [Trypanosoma vivax]KAH8610916.1 hypothetical protein ERJ75_001046900 [Trypanosoma vivax]CCC50174.1 conserved hypothetical protein [Trypanosoma vivax Y486]
MNGEEAGAIPAISYEDVRDALPPSRCSSAAEGEHEQAAEDMLCHVLHQLEEGESYSRGVLHQHWFRGASSIMVKAELERAEIAIKNKAGFGSKDGSDGAADENREAHNSAATLNQYYHHEKVRLKLMYDEDLARRELLLEEHNMVNILWLMMSESHERWTLFEEHTTTHHLITAVMKPKVYNRYIYAWGIMCATSFKPMQTEVDRIHHGQRHKPEYMRRLPLTCRIPLEPDCHLQWPSSSEPVPLISMRPNEVH